MPTKIQLKRGMKQNLPLLNAGEGAFTTDTKEFYIGTGTKNYNMSPIGENIIVNGNFQISLTEEDGAYPTRQVVPGEGTYLFGNYYLQNDASASGNITITRTYTDGMITLSCDNAIPTLEYRERLSRYVSALDTYSSVKSNLNEMFTVSYDAYNSTASDVTVQCGIPASLGNLVIPTTNTRVNYTFQLTNYVGDYMSVVLLKLTTAFSGSFTVGNFKLEQGEYSSKYTPNSAVYDLACLNQVYQGFSTYVTPYKQDTNNLYFLISNHIGFPYGEDYTAILDEVMVMDLSNDGAIETGFTNSIAMNTTYNMLEVTSTQNSHGLTQAAACIKGFIDLRP